MNFIYLYPATHDYEADMLDAGPVPDIALAAERSGFAAFGLTEHPITSSAWMKSGGHQTLDPFVALGAAAASTERIRLMTYLSIAAYRNPFLLAKAAATLDKLSGGRVILGLGAGYLESEFAALGVDMKERNALFDEALEVLPLHWSGEEFSYRGHHFDAEGVVSLPRPVQDPIPIWIGGNADRSRRRVIEKAQGWIPMVVPPDFATSTRTIPINGLAHLSVLVSEIRAAASNHACSKEISVAHAYLDPTISSPTVDVDRHIAAFGEMEDAGLTHVAVSSPTSSRSETLDFIEAFGANYCP